MTELYVFRREEPLSPEWAELLPSWRLERFSGRRNEAARQESLTAGLLWAFAMKKHGRETGSVMLLPAGKPILADGSLWFSLSHSGVYALCALSDAPVGCDVQLPRPVKLSVARRFCKAEQEWLLSLPEKEQLTALLRLWTRKEAWVKAASRDRVLGLDEYDVRTGDEWFFRDLTLPEDIPAALCGREALPDEFVLVTREELLSGLGK